MLWQRRQRTVTSSPPRDHPRFSRRQCFRDVCFRRLAVRRLRTGAPVSIPLVPSISGAFPHAFTRQGHVRGRNDHRRPERDAHCRRAVVCPGPWIPENQGSIGGLRLREISVVIRQLRLSAAPTTGRPVSGSPPWCACLRPGLSSGAFRWLTVTSAASTDGWSASGHVPLRTGRSAVEFDVSVDGFPEQGRQVSSPTRP